MPRPIAACAAPGFLLLAACAGSAFALRPLPRILADGVGEPVARLEEVFGTPRKVDVSPNREVYFWFVADAPAGVDAGLHGCELEISVDPRSRRVIGASLADVGWAQCGQIERRIRIAAN